MDELTKVLSNTKYKNVKIGAENGSGFFYAGSVDNYLKNTDRVDRACHLAAKQSVSRRKARIETLCKNCPTAETYIRKSLSRNDAENMTAENYLKFLDKYFNTVRNVTKEMQKAEELLAHWEPLAQRRIVRKEESTVDEDCLIVIINGYEQGSYWMLEEAPKGEEVCFELDTDEANDIYKNVEERVA